MSDEERVTKGDGIFEERLRQFRGSEPPASCWASIADRIESRTRVVWRYLPAAAAVLLVIAAATVALLTQRGQMQKPTTVRIAHAQVRGQAAMEDTSGPGLLVSSGNDVW